MEVLTITPFGGGGGGGDASVAGSDTQIQYNDGGSLGASADLTWDDTAKELGVAGDINLDDGGTYSTTLQMVTATANRTISFPDATGTVALVSGSNGTIQYNDAGTLKGNSDFTVDPDWNDASTVFTGLKLNVTDTASAAASNLLDLQVNGSSKLRINNTSIVTGLSLVCDTISPGSAGFFLSSSTIRVASTGYLGFSSTLQAFATPDVTLYRDAANTLAQRNGTNAQTFRLYNTYTDASNYERTSITRDSSGLVIDAQKGGTGADPTNLLDLQRAGVSAASVSTDSTGTGYLKLIPTTVNALTPAATVGAGTKAFVTDSTSTLSSHHGQVVAGGGSNFVPVFSDGTNWIVG